MTGKQPSNTLQRFFAGTAENVFQSQLGLADPPLVDYLSEMLLRFVRLDSLHAVRNIRGGRLARIGDMLAEAESRIGDARRETHRHIGDFALFWTGLYPEALRSENRRDRMDFFLDYCVQGKRAYLVASSIEASSEEAAPAEVLERLSRQFEMCAYGLREVRREWERSDEQGPGPLLIE